MARLKSVFRYSNDNHKNSFFGPSEAEFSPDEITRGGSFSFVFRQQFKRPLNVRSIGVFLVYRERIIFSIGSDSSETTDFDRLIAQDVHSCQQHSADDTIIEAHHFQIPTRTMGLRSPDWHQQIQKSELMWVVKVRINYGKPVPLWREYEVKIAQVCSRQTLGEAEIETAGRFDLVMIRSAFNNFATSKVIEELCAHLDFSQTTSVSSRLILENVTKREAIEAKRKLEATGASVEIMPAFAFYEATFPYLKPEKYA